jgi:hypothetical protein
VYGSVSTDAARTGCWSIGFHHGGGWTHGAGETFRHPHCLHDPLATGPQPDEALVEVSFGSDLTRVIAGNRAAGGPLPQPNVLAGMRDMLIAILEAIVKLLQAATLLAIVASPAIAQSTITPSTQSSGARLQDTTGIPGKPGGKSGPAAMPPSRSAQKP